MLRKFPALRAIIKRFVLILGDYIDQIFLRNNYFNKELEFFQDKKNDTFFGYYDISPENQSGLVIANSFSKDTGKKYLCIFGKDKNNPIKRLRIQTHNLQIGVRAQWINADQFVYNDLNESDGKIYYSIYSLKKNKVILQKRDYFYKYISEDKFVSINTDLISKHDPDYKFTNVKACFNSEDPVLKISSLSGDDLYNLQSSDLNEEFGGCCINHVQISPNNDYLIFIKRSIVNKIRVDSLWRLSLWFKLNKLTDDCIVSHYCFINNSSIFIYFAPKADYSYHVLDIESGRYNKVKNLSNFRDGHPSIKNKKVVTDTYPNIFGYQKLYYGDAYNFKMQEVLKIKHPSKFFGNTRCDLHPRFSLCGKKIYFDTVCNGYRSLARMDLDKEQK